MASLSSVRESTTPMSSRSGKNTSTSVMPRFGERLPEFGRQRLVGFQQNFAGLPVDDVGHAVRAFEVRQRRANLRNLGLDQFLEEIFGDALVRADNHFFGLRDCLISCDSLRSTMPGETFQNRSLSRSEMRST